MSKCYVGIDPAFRKDGFVICIIDEDNTADFKIFGTSYDFIEWLFDAPYNALWCIENSNLQDQTFDTTGNKFVVAKKSRDAGKNMAVSQITVDVCRKKFGASNVLELSPKQKGRKIEDNAVFLAIVAQEGVKLLNYKGNKGEQDKRDAFMLAIRAKRWKKSI
jgi:hypothetical protein